jgi:predicted oxidoreductase (fatty acid repression mutant protein)
MADKITLMDAIALRRSIHALAPESPVSDDRILKIVQHALTHGASPFNVQSARAVILLKKEHEKLWDLAADAASKSFPASLYESLKPKLAQYRAGYGTVMWFEDQQRFSDVEQQLGPAVWAGVKNKMPQWSEHSTGMHQYAVWMALVAEGFGCNLQHYSPFIDKSVQEQWNIPSDWSLKAQLVFGKPVGPPREKTVLSLEQRVIVHKS